MEAVKTNVVGTMNVVRACLENNVGRVSFISTDKACKPINSYGATKMLGEKGDFRHKLLCAGLDKYRQFIDLVVGLVVNAPGFKNPLTGQEV